MRVLCIHCRPNDLSCRAPAPAARPAFLLVSLALMAAGHAPATLAVPGAVNRQAQRILDAAGVQGGIVVHVGCRDGRLTAALHASESFIVQGLDRNPRNVDTARARIRSTGLYGRVSAELWAGGKLPYIDNLVNLLVVSAGETLAKTEIQRVLCPRGVAVFLDGPKNTVASQWRKPWPQGMDEWTHYLHDSTNNAVAHDTFIAPLGRYQWVGSTRYSRHHDHMSSISAAVSAKGRVFYIFDAAPRASILIPPQWRLIARDAFNGVVLWERPISRWHSHLWPLKSGPQLLTRRLVAVGDRVYVTLGIDSTLTALDAATGKTVRTYEGTKATEEILYNAGVLFLSVARRGQPLRSDPNRSYANMREIRQDVTNPLWTQAPRTIMAVDAASGNVLWQRESMLVSMSLTADTRNVLFHDGEKIVCLNRRTGGQRWSSRPLPKLEKMRSSCGVTLVSYGDVILYSGRVAAEKYKLRSSTTMFALSATDGRSLWQAEHPPCGHQGTPDDILVAGGLVWSGAVASPRDSGVMIGRDLHTGEVKSRFLPDVQTHWFHHRCYRAKATDRYLLFSRTGIEFIDYAKKHWICHHWVRGACLYGVLPANGLIYTPQHPCACYLEAKLFGFAALAPAAPDKLPRRRIPDAERLLRGTAYDEAILPFEPQTADWPTYRGDAQRSGFARTAVRAMGLRQAWTTALGGKLSSLTAADGKVFVASVDAHTLHALDATTGAPVWSFVAGGRVDSPPTIWRGRVLFGCADGRIYCLMASDGRLVWRYRAAPENLRMGGGEQIESVWPVHGSVLVQNDVLYCVAGRSMFLDGGLRFLRLDPKTGRKLSETILDDRDPKTKKNLQSDVKGLNMPVALPDILSSDGSYVYMRSLPFTLDGRRKFVAYVPVSQREGDDLHLFSPTGFLDGTLWHRTYWIYGRAFSSGASGYYLAGRVEPSGRLLVFDERRVYGYGRLWRYYRWTTPLEFHLFAAPKRPRVVPAGTERRPIRKNGKVVGRRTRFVTRFAHDWSDQLPVQVCAMVLAENALFAAGPPDEVDEERAGRRLNDPETIRKLADQEAAFAARRGGLLVAVRPNDGKLLASYRLRSPPLFDGMIAANGRLYLSTRDGKVLCLSTKAGQPLPVALGAKVTARPPDPVLKPSAPKVGLPSAATEFAVVDGAWVWRTKHGYRVCTDAQSKTGIVLRKLPTPLTGKVTFRTRLRANADTTIRRGRSNGYLVFGASPETGALVTCGVMVKAKKALIAEGGGRGANTASKRLFADFAKEQEIIVTVDPTSNSVTLSVGGQTVSLKLKTGLKRIGYVGYCVQSAISDFGPIRIGRE
ncbi:MAG: PQQ-binding-like beta-propeller repeat protein [Kiritimatiellaeota bacterium]|nr:PQQ-binding-like beta-propeller repeat protein [Kiritimatiellota bacterium]